MVIAFSIFASRFVIAPYQGQVVARVEPAGPDGAKRPRPGVGQAAAATGASIAAAGSDGAGLASRQAAASAAVAA